MKRRLGMLKRDRSGVVAVEFAILAPLMLFFFLGMVELSQAHMLRKALETNVTTIADLVSRQRELSPADAQGLVASFKQLMEPDVGPFDAVTTSFYIASISRQDASTPQDASTLIVDWSVNQDMKPAFVAGSTYTDVKIDNDGLLRPGVSVIVVMVRYSGEDAFAHEQFFGGASNAAAKQIQRHAIRWPRRSMRVALLTPP